jgi:hypothetical protein
MAVRLRYSVAVAVSSNSNEDRDLGNVKFEVVTDVEVKGGAWKTVVPAGATDLQLNMDNISTIQLLAIRTYTNDPNDTPGGVTVKRNSTLGEPILIKPVGDALEGVMVLTTDLLTALFASNASGVDMVLQISAVGT